MKSENGIDAAYFRTWRAEHPEYRERQKAVRRARRLLVGRSDRSAESRNRPSRAIQSLPLPQLHQGHPLFDKARELVGPERSTLTTLVDPLYEDLLSVAVVALLQGLRPYMVRRRVERYRRRERRWGWSTTTLNDDIGRHEYEER